MRLKYSFFVVFTCISLGGMAQQDPQFTQYMFNNLYTTPAFAGVEGVSRLTALYRNQWTGYQSSFDDGGAPATQMISFNTPIFKANSGFGTYILNDNLGPVNNLEIQASYAYHLGINNSKLSLGLRVGAYAQTINYDLYRPIHPNDPALEGKSGKDSQIRPDMSVGAFYRAEKWYGGIGFNHLLKSEFNFGPTTRNALANHIHFTAGYIQQVNFDIEILYSTLIKTDFNKMTFDAGFLATYKNLMWGGLSFRRSEAAILMLGYNLFKDKSLKLGAGLDYIIKDQAAKQPVSFEIMLSYELPVSPGTGKKVVRTPRYRH